MTGADAPGEVGPPDDDAPAPAHSWPLGRAIPDEQAILTQCASCGAPWRVHKSLMGFKLRCHCTAWLEVPSPTPASDPPGAATGSTGPVPVLPDPEHVEAPRFDERGLAVLPGDPDETLFARVRTDLPLAPGELRRASASNQARWTNRTLLEFLAMLAALAGPQIAAFALAGGGEFELLLPIASLCSAVLVAFVVMIAGPWGSLGFRPARPRHYGEALLVAAAGVPLALGWVRLVQTLVDGSGPDVLGELAGKLGLPMALVVIALTPAVLEEVIFRGLLQGRLLALLGVRAGLVATAAAFALCHGQPMALPIHVGLGLYLGWLRLRAQSLWPGMLLHFTYNGALTVLAAP